MIYPLLILNIFKRTLSKLQTPDINCEAYILYSSRILGACFRACTGGGLWGEGSRGKERKDFHIF